jgi:hypothetical protein
MFRFFTVILLVFCVSSCTRSFVNPPTLTTLKNKAITPSVPQIKDYKQLKGKQIRLDVDLPDDHLMIFFPEHTDMILTLGSQGNGSLFDQLKEDSLVQYLTRAQCRKLLTSAPNYATYRWRLQHLIE